MLQFTFVVVYLCNICDSNLAFQSFKLGENMYLCGTLTVQVLSPMLPMKPLLTCVTTTDLMRSISADHLNTSFTKESFIDTLFSTEKFIFRLTTKELFKLRNKSYWSPPHGNKEHSKSPNDQLQRSNISRRKSNTS